ncbi:helix-turn-helix domain-containing protein [Streptomyces sp. RY43-2]|uniref:Helix-turn-helix domain-containing protein n=1 Tax=Streptomyces macrolidinus TaxID=2952607 RepID=A0ABT0ZCT8_9ACTN|nr:helix-turn-helix domain-containing protein [Streptomyces macrolidinus]MCN9241397.1 helix-turn-helix domain-containing protein [Streptomyces macrolidinus]
MGTENPSVPRHTQWAVATNEPHSRANSRTRNRPRAYGVTHDNTRHTTRFTVIGNHLAQHAELSLVAIALAVHIQSLPSNAPVDIKTLANRFPEGRTRIAAGLRELEAHGYLRRVRERTSTGNIVTRTISCNQPKAPRAPGPAVHEERPAAKPDEPRKKTKKKQHPLPPVPQPAHPSPALLRTATDLLAGLRHQDPRLLLSACDTAHLAPGVAAWLQRDVPPAAVRHALTSALPPEGVRRPAALLAHRLTAQLPPPPPFRAPPPVPHPLQNCDTCDRAFRAPEPGSCRDCRSATPEGAP